MITRPKAAPAQSRSADLQFVNQAARTTTEWQNMRAGYLPKREDHLNSNDLQYAILGFVGYSLMTPIFFYVIIRLLGTMIEMIEPWRSGKVAPLLPFTVKPKKQNRAITRRVTAVCRFYGAPLSKNLDELNEKYSSASIPGRWFSAVMIYPPIFGIAILFCILTYIPDDGYYHLNKEGLKGIAVAIGASACQVIFLIRGQVNRRRWRAMANDQEALISCFQLLQACGSLTRRRARAREIERRTNILCSELLEFATYHPGFSAHRRAEVLNHIASVQAKLRDAAGNILRDGSTQIGDLVQLTGTLLERIMDDRWLGLLDNTTEADSSTTGESDTLTGRRDLWIIIAGSLAAAGILAVAAALGMPLGVAVPVALVFLLGPASLWGSRRLNTSPSGILDSVRGAVSSAPQGELTPGSQQPAPEPTTVHGANSVRDANPDSPDTRSTP